MSPDVGDPAFEDRAVSSPPDETLAKAASDARFQYFIRQVLDPPRDPDRSELLGVKLPVDRLVLQVLQLVHGARRNVQKA